MASLNPSPGWEKQSKQIRYQENKILRLHNANVEFHRVMSLLNDLRNDAINVLRLALQMVATITIYVEIFMLD